MSASGEDSTRLLCVLIFLQDKCHSYEAACILSTVDKTIVRTSHYPLFLLLWFCPSCFFTSFPNTGQFCYENFLFTLELVLTIVSINFLMQYQYYAFSTFKFLCNVWSDHKCSLQIFVCMFMGQALFVLNRLGA